MQNWYSPCLENLTIVPATGDIDGCPSSKGTQQHLKMTHNNQLLQRNACRLWKLGRDHLFDPKVPFCMNLGIAKLAEEGGRYWINISKKIQQSTEWGSFAYGVHGVAEMIHCGMDMHANSTILEYCNKHGGTAEMARAIILCFTSPIWAIGNNETHTTIN